MTVEIRELVVQARIVADDDQPKAVPDAWSIDDRWLDIVVRRVLERLLDQQPEWRL